MALHVGKQDTTQDENDQEWAKNHLRTDCYEGYNITTIKMTLQHRFQLPLLVTFLLYVRGKIF